ncbi:MAG: hypothetical protein K2N38_13675 [Oscillospiraceae bacterium]|nr:hypothetical protein [Oscillospiraceae bacterium]
MVKTVILDGPELKVSGPDGDNAEIHNFGMSTVYASKSPNITADADNVIAISAGAIDGLSGTHGTVYLLGKGKVQVSFTDEKITRTSVSSVSNASGNGSGVMQEYVDEKDADTLAAAKEYADALSADIYGYIGYTDNDIYGLEADFDSVRAYGGRRRCNLSDSGKVFAYYGDEDFKADGSNGQVMVEQPCFYYKVVPLKTEKIDGANGYHLRKARYYISDTPKAGFKVHPAFVRNGVEVDRIYLSAFEWCIYDASAGAYLLNDEQAADFNADKLSSIAGTKPCSEMTQALTRANTRMLAHNRGIGWEQATSQAVSATQLLFIIEYASFDSQSAIGRGNTDLAAITDSIQKTGDTIALGNSSGAIVNVNGISIAGYRGEENIWGNIWIWIDGINIVTPQTQIYVADHNFSDNIADPYKKHILIRQVETAMYLPSDTHRKMIGCLSNRNSAAITRFR